MVTFKDIEGRKKSEEKKQRGLVVSKYFPYASGIVKEELCFHPVP